MGNHKKQLSWTWPLISLYWIPEILSCLGSLDDPSWMLLNREMTAFVPNRSFADRLFLQVKTFLKESNLVREEGRHVILSVDASNENIRKHLEDYFRESSSNWVMFYRLVSDKEVEINYKKLKENPPEIWPEIKEYPIFKQWTNFLQFIGYGILLTNEEFIPDSAVSSSMYRDHMFIQKCLKANSDPRCLTGNYSLHPEVDFLYWSRGEENLRISRNSSVSPRIPHDDIIRTMDSQPAGNASLFYSLQKAKDEFKKNIKEEIDKYPFSNLHQFIFTCKHLLDYFLFGEPAYQTDHVNIDQIHRVKEMWNTVKDFKMPEYTWKMMPNLYRDISRLYWGISFYRTNLQRPIKYKFNDCTINYNGIQEIRDMPVRCFRSKRTIFSIYQILFPILKALMKLEDYEVAPLYQRNAEEIVNFIANYIPPDELDIVEIFDDISRLVNLSNNDREALLSLPKLDKGVDEPDHLLLRTCYWIHKYSSLKNNPSVMKVMMIKDKLDELEKNLFSELNRYQQPHERLNLAIRSLQEKTLSLKSNIA